MRPVPWAWITRILLSTGITIAWAAKRPREVHIWQLFLVASAAVLGLEGLRIGYRYEQECIRRRRDRSGGI